MTHPRSWIRTLCITLFAGSMLLAPVASAQDSIFGFPIPRVEQGPNRSITITIAPGVLPAINVPAPPVRRTDPSRTNLPPAQRPPVYRPPVYQPPVQQRPVDQPALNPWGAPTPGPRAPAAQLPPPRTPPPFAVPAAPTDGPGAAPALGLGTGRTYGVFVGITDYPNANNLPFCAEDARRVQRAFLNAGMRAQDSVVLTDAAATRGNIANALNRFNRVAGPNDTVVFFFSGHGGQTADQNGDEADGTDETIVFVDGAITDDELQSLLRPGQARDFVALDSCYSGGFAQDLARLNNSVGFYASREDQLSYVAPEYQAGGYLSYYLAQNITRMGGRAVPMWELQRDLRADFDESGTSSRQELTVGVSRSVNTRTVLFDAPSDRPTVVAQR